MSLPHIPLLSAAGNLSKGSAEHHYVSIGWRISGYIFTISCFLALAILFSSGYLNYKAELRRVFLQQEEVENAQVPVLASALWNYEFHKIEKQLKGLLTLQHVAFVELQSPGHLLRYGKRSGSDDAIERSFHILYGDNRQPLGQLQLVYSKQSVRESCINQLKRIFVPVLLQVLLTALIIIAVYAKLLTRHLKDLSEYTRELDRDNLSKGFRFHRASSHKKDELDLLLESIDTMRKNLINQLEDRERMEKQLQRNSKMEALGTLAGGVAHDLNNILTGVVSYPELVMCGYPADSKIYKSLEKIRDSGLRASAIVQDLLTLTRRAVPTFSPLSINQLIKAYLDSPEFMKIMEDRHEVAVEVHLDPCNPVVLGSDIHIGKSLMNLVFNGFEAIKGAGTLRISTHCRAANAMLSFSSGVYPDGAVEIAVEDTGVGISPADQEKIFEPFYTKKVMGRSGSGLGMTVVYGTVQDHCGEIFIKSEQGKGARIMILLPLTEQSVADPVKGTEVGAIRGHDQKILVVDDLREQREVAEDILTTLGYRVINAVSGEDALKTLAQQTVELILLDMIMGEGMDGYDTLKELKKRYPEIPVILVSGYSDTGRTRQALDHGAACYVRKPYQMESIARAVAEQFDPE